MKLSNFELLSVEEGRHLFDRRWHAVLKVTTGFWLWKKSKFVRIAKSYGGYWYWLHNGHYTPGYEVEALERAYRARTGDER